jgi:hypothetical protein
MIISFNCFDISLVHSTVSCYKVYTIGRRSFNNTALSAEAVRLHSCACFVVSDVFRLNENPIHASSEQLQPSSEPDGLTVVSRGAGGEWESESDVEDVELEVV